MFGSICPCGVEGFAWLDKREIFVLSDSACIYEHAGQRACLFYATRNKTNNQEEHDKIVLKVLRQLEEHDLFIKPEKCSFRVKEVEFLGMTVSAEGIKMNNDKVKAIL